ncbi:CBS domain-containing protein CBSX1, chloroplastic isoform X3 [Ziziphus jujuba]|uniref:CBS domain-containing protein CBSX1, chloroplastic isoform X3 n=1 Tax=Ziziphus jujuba TaxID=326968 RepID=A0ABM4AE99_ZIZJJ|nr:CBS domain-containing protein CBSX1, chloroplastic isoform X3 [Ziziphus jujuba]
MASISVAEPFAVISNRLACPTSVSSAATFFACQLPCLLLSRPRCRLLSVSNSAFRCFRSSDGVFGSLRRFSSVVAASGTLTANSLPVGLVSDYDLLALDSISVMHNFPMLQLGGGQTDDLFPEVDSSWKTFNEVQKLLSKTNGKLIGDVMTPAPVVVRETTNLEDAARLLLETKYRRLPVVDADGKLVGIITRGNVVRAALLIKHATEMKA